MAEQTGAPGRVGFLSISEAADQLAVHRTTVYRRMEALGMKPTTSDGVGYLTEGQVIQIAVAEELGQVGFWNGEFVESPSHAAAWLSGGGLKVKVDGGVLKLTLSARQIEAAVLSGAVSGYRPDTGVVRQALVDYLKKRHGLDGAITSDGISPL